MKTAPEISELKVSLAQQLFAMESLEALEEVKYYLDAMAKGDDFWDELDLQEQKEILKGMAEIEAGKEIPAEEVFRKYGL